MKKINLLVDYKGRFGFKDYDMPYRSGFDKEFLSQAFLKRGFAPEFVHFSDVNFIDNNYLNQLILYTSSEDLTYTYKSYIEDIVLGLERNGAIVIPEYIYLRANNNKVFMEILREQMSNHEVKNIRSHYFGVYEDYLNKKDFFTEEKYVIKKAKGASGTGVFLSKNPKQIASIIKKVSRIKNLPAELWEIGRALKHKGYIKESKYRKKYIIQDFIPELKNDWKIYVFGDKYFIFYRPVFKKREFKASGGGYDNYFYGIDANPPIGIFDFAEMIFDELKIPNVSLDICHDGTAFYLLEFQCLYFGTAGLSKSKEYFTKISGTWQPIQNNFSQEQIYVDSIVDYITKNNL